MRVNPYLTFNGDCAEAFAFYESALGGKTDVITFASSPMAEHVSEAWRDKVMHAQFDVGGDVIMGSDAMEGQTVTHGGAAVFLQFDDPDEAERLFAALSDGGNVTMPIAETFWAVRFGMFTDKFGVPWMVNCNRPA